MNPYQTIKENVNQSDSLLSLCSGIGLEFRGLSVDDITAVDVSSEYVEVLKEKYPHIKAVNSDALEFIKKQPDNSYDVVTFVDGLEHMPKKTGKQVLSHVKRVARKKVILFFPQGEAPDGYLRNEPHNAWGVEGADEYQTHKSGWTKQEAIDLGFTLLQEVQDTSQHGEPYKALMFIYEK
jgi:ubiquinone/menaquinone biosynthesis C-methylase UbiE